MRQKQIFSHWLPSNSYKCTHQEPAGAAGIQLPLTGYPRHRENRENRENGRKNSLSGKTQGIWKFCQNTGKTQGIWYAQDVISLILKVIFFLSQKDDALNAYLKR